MSALEVTNARKWSYLVLVDSLHAAMRPMSIAPKRSLGSRAPSSP